MRKFDVIDAACKAATRLDARLTFCDAAEAQNATATLRAADVPCSRDGATVTMDLRTVESARYVLQQRVHKSIRRRMRAQEIARG